MMTKLIAAAIAAFLIGCGGSEEDDRADTNPVDCRANPQMCQ